MNERREAVKLSNTDSDTQRITLTSDLVGPVAWQRRFRAVDAELAAQWFQRS